MVQKITETTQRTVELVRPVTRPRIVGEIPVAPKDLTTPHSGSAPLTIQLCAHNYMPYTIYLIDRSGAVFRIPPSMFNNVAFGAGFLATVIGSSAGFKAVPQPCHCFAASVWAVVIATSRRAAAS